MKIVRTFIAALLAPLLFTGTGAAATELELDGGWSGFSFGAAGSAWSETFTFVTSSVAFLRITDAYLAGDRFLVKVNGSQSFSALTSIPGTSPDSMRMEYETAATSAIWSNLTLILDPGTYTISGSLFGSPNGFGWGAIQLSSTPTAVPVPGPEAGAGLGALAMGGLAFWMQRRRQSGSLSS
jgi:hypothetical protein